MVFLEGWGKKDKQASKFFLTSENSSWPKCMSLEMPLKEKKNCFAGEVLGTGSKKRCPLPHRDRHCFGRRAAGFTCAVSSRLPPHGAPAACAAHEAAAEAWDTRSVLQRLCEQPCR